MVEDDLLSSAKSILFCSDTKEKLSDETKEKLSWIKKDIAKEYINSLKKNNSKIEDIELLESYLINDGEVEAFDTPKNLLKISPTYQKMVTLQELEREVEGGKPDGGR